MRACSLTEWTLLPYVLTSVELTNANESASLKRYDRVSHTCIVRRGSKYYLYNIALTEALLVLLSTTAKIVPLDEFADRMSISLTLLLTSIALWFVVAEKLPNLSYQTHLDKFNSDNLRLQEAKLKDLEQEHQILCLLDYQTVSLS